MIWNRHSNHLVNLFYSAVSHLRNAHYRQLLANDLIVHILADLVAHQAAGDGGIVVDHVAVRFTLGKDIAASSRKAGRHLIREGCDVDSFIASCTL